MERKIKTSADAIGILKEYSSTLQKRIEVLRETAMGSFTQTPENYEVKYSIYICVLKDFEALNQLISVLESGDNANLVGYEFCIDMLVAKSKCWNSDVYDALSYIKNVMFNEANNYIQRLSHDENFDKKSPVETLPLLVERLTRCTSCLEIAENEENRNYYQGEVNALKEMIVYMVNKI